MNAPRYALFPGKVVSRNDRQVHHVDALALARLYGVSIAECAIVPEIYTSPGSSRGERDALIRMVESRGMLQLHPRSDGDYRLPEAAT